MQWKCAPLPPQFQLPSKHSLIMHPIELELTLFLNKNYLPLVYFDHLMKWLLKAKATKYFDGRYEAQYTTSSRLRKELQGIGAQNVLIQNWRTLISNWNICSLEIVVDTWCRTVPRWKYVDLFGGSGVTDNKSSVWSVATTTWRFKTFQDSVSKWNCAWLPRNLFFPFFSSCNR